AGVRVALLRSSLREAVAARWPAARCAASRRRGELAAPMTESAAAEARYESEADADREARPVPERIVRIEPRIVVGRRHVDSLVSVAAPIFAGRRLIDDRFD